MKPQHRSIKYVRDRDPMPRHSKTCITAAVRVTSYEG
jgi:hypothetical protein